MAHPTTLRLILGDQLNSKHSWFRSAEEHVTYVLMEVMQEATYTLHHIQKVVGFFAAMRAFAEGLKRHGHRVLYLRLDDPENRQTFEENIQLLIRRHGFERVEYQLPDEYRLDRILRSLEGKLRVPVSSVDSEHFLSDRAYVQRMFAGKKRFLMESFYRRMRVEHDVLMEGGKPSGGEWNFDRENRRRYDGSVELPPSRCFTNDVRAITDMLARMNVRTFGHIEPERFIWPVDREQSLDLLRSFLKQGLPHFGTYEDAMTVQSWALYHSRLSFALNTKMLHPMEVIEAAEREWKKKPDRIALHQVEGFVRQILGWREFMRGAYWAMMPKLRSANYFGHKAKLPQFYWDGRTTMKCMQIAIGQSLRYAYAHHIQRLMITGNFALLTGIDPAAVDAWYLGVYIDAIEWVEMPNTRGMSQFADGGMIATKPYVASANYIKKMSDYCTGCRYDPVRKYGERACPFNSLYWEFHVRHRKKLERNPRIGMVYRTWDRMAEGERDRILQQARLYKEKLEEL
ncbi:MAG: cryptochrome/photolyase family protein [Bacteroidetes bacterium]|jgi:deoxyribodipyrimidine photolyase-related protein|nr:cryptochrome/photolyase family protein [Bacteroidota bacterium]